MAWVKAGGRERQSLGGGVEWDCRESAKGRFGLQNGSWAILGLEKRQLLGVYLWWGCKGAA